MARTTNPPHGAPVEDQRASRVDGWKPRVWRNDLFKQLAQAVLEPPSPRHDERATLEYIQNHLAGDGGVVVARQSGIVEA